MSKYLFSSSTLKGAIVGIAGWFILIGLVSSLAPALSEVTTNDQNEFLPAGAESVEAIDIRSEKFPSSEGIPALVVFNSSDATEGRNSAVSKFTEAARSNNAPKTISSVLSPYDSPATQQTLVSSDGSTSMVIVTLSGSPASVAFEEAVEWLSDQASKSGANL